ncbi:MAG TPA: VWA domain-containing protein [Cyclobacteriaceae bacterium]
MEWYRSFGSTEWLFVIAFLVLYGIYFYRTFSLATKYGQGGINVIIKFLLRSTYFALFIVALLGPSFGENKREIKAVGKDIFIALDLSVSMNAFDIQPTRLERIKFEIKNIVEAFNSDRIGLIMFSSEAYVQCPLTYDKNAVNLFIETLNTNLVPNAGTDFGPPLEMALDKLNDDNSPLSSQKSKIIVLISDGEDFGEDTQSVAEKLESSGIRLFTLGVGTQKGSKILASNGYKRDRQGNDVITKLNPTSLKKLAANTGGKYFELSNRTNDVNRLINAISNIEGELRDAKKIDVSANKYYYFLGLGIILLILDLLISLKTFKI